MSQGRSNKLIGATGEYLVAAELSRRGLIATTFTGNVPHFDIIAANVLGQHVSVQVKASRFSTWQFSDISQFCQITISDDIQTVGAPKPPPIVNLIMVFVQVRVLGEDSFFVIDWEALRDILIRHHSDYLEKHQGRRPKNPHSLHAALNASDLHAYRDRWDLVESHLH